MFDVIVVGGGHAGVEAAYAASKLNKKTALVTGNLNRVAFLSCNPAMGGPAKGIIIREIDAMGGIMGKVTDATQIQIKMLNQSKGPAVWALRAQVDKVEYPKEMLKVLQNQENLTLIEGLVENLIIENKKVIGVELDDKTRLYSKATIITTGTYLNSDILIGEEVIKQAADLQPTTFGISNNLKDAGFKIIRLRTATPPRVFKESINTDILEVQYGDSKEHKFSFDYVDIKRPKEVCYITRTNIKTHLIIEQNLHKTAMYSGAAKGAGPRYCPSIEDKIVRFHTKESHLLFLEPESLSNDEIYIQGLFTALPKDVQLDVIRSIKGLENAEVASYAYGIEYDAIDPTQLKQTLETTLVENLYCAGQINGTSGYEEAAGQGIMAGINASLKIDGKDPFILKRDEAYIGVLIDDLVSKGTDEPYRLFTSRAEYRLLLRNDNADIRLRDYGYKYGMIDEEIYQKFLRKKEDINKIKEVLNKTHLFPTKETNKTLKDNGFPEIRLKESLTELLKRPNIPYNIIRLFTNLNYDDDLLEHVEIEIKYAGYINKEENRARKMQHDEQIMIPNNIDYDSIKNLATEAKEKLKQIRPKTIGQAKRISGVNPTDITILRLYVNRLK